MAGQFPRPWSFRLGSMTRPTTAPVQDQPRPVPTRIIRPPIIRPALLTEPEPTTPKEPAKSPPQLPRPAASLTPPIKKEPPPPPPPSLSPPAALPRLNHVPSPRPVVPPPVTVLTRPVVPLPAVTRPVAPSPEGRSSIAGSPAKNEAFDKGGGAKQGSPVPSSPSIQKSIPAVPSPYMSPKLKVAASPPSPLVLPPPQLKSSAVPNHESIPQEVERKTVVFQKVKEKSPTTNEEENGKVKENQEKVKGINGAKKGLVRSDVDKDSNTRVITMAGENMGASMEIVTSDKNEPRLRIRQSNSSNNNNNVNETENGDNKSTKKSTASRNNGALPIKGFFNSNVQGINNSILMDSKFAHHDPGIHLHFSKMPTANKEADKEQH